MMNNCTDDFEVIIDEPVSITNESKGLCSGFGKFATDKIKNPNGDVELDSSQLNTTRMANIKELADNPESVKKDVAQWVIFSDVKTRTRSKQREQGRYYALWADIDENPIPLEQLAILLGEYFPNTDYELYTSKSAKENYQKSRIIIPLLNTVSGDDFELLQECLNDWLASKNIIPDRASETCNQVCYLPNKGEYYNNISLRDGVYLDGLKHFTNQLKQKKTELAQLQVERTERKKQTEIKRQQRTASGFASPIDEFNDLYPVEGILEANGYIADGARYIHPDSESGAASVSILNGRAHSLSSSDRLYTGGVKGSSGTGEGAHDAFSVFCLFGHNGDEKAAIIDAGNNYLNIGGESWNKVKQREYAEKEDDKAIEDAFSKVDEVEMLEGDIDLTTILGADSPLGHYTASLAKMAQMPVNTVFHTILSVVSSVLTRSYSISYQHDSGIVPIILNLLAEQPPGTSKSRVLKNVQSGVFEAVKEERKRIKEELEKLSKEEENEDKEKTTYALKKRNEGLFSFTTDTTPEALDATLSDTGGFFALASAEQGLINTLLGLSYSKGSAANIDLMLKGFNGEYHSSKRKTRETYTGNVIGGFTCLAQVEVIVKTLKESGSTGLIERCILWSEPSLIGQRDHLNKYFMPKDMAKNFQDTLGYLAKLSFDNQSKDFEDLPTLRLTDVAWHKIDLRRNQLEQTLIGGGENSAQLLQGFISKIDMFVIKIGAVLHSMDTLLRGVNCVQSTIDDKFIEQALAIYNAMLTHTKGLIKNSSIVALSDREVKILDLIENSSRGVMSLKAIKDKLYRASCFKVNGKGDRNTVTATVEQMANESLLNITHEKGDILLSKA